MKNDAWPRTDGDENETKRNEKLGRMHAEGRERLLKECLVARDEGKINERAVKKTRRGSIEVSHRSGTEILNR